MLAQSGGTTLSQDDAVVITPEEPNVQNPTQLTVVQASATALELRWRYEGNTDFVDFVIERRSGTGSMAEITTITTGETSYTDTQLSPATRYTYQVYAERKGDAAQRSNLSNEASGATQSTTAPEIISNGDYVPQYNGNIAGIKWNAQGFNQPQEKLYYFQYDRVNRLTAARYAERSSTTAWGNGNGDYSVDGISYDANGNIGGLTRFTPQGGRHAIDQLSYSYTGNQLTAVSDVSGSYQGFADRNTSGDDYDYDDNGNLREDKNKYITEIQYNLLNLPELITFEKEGNTATIQYLYDATGGKLRKIVTDYEGEVTTTDYIGGIQYVQQGSEPKQLELIQHEEGRVVPASTGVGYAYHYDIRDHLGNARVTFSSETVTDEYLATMENDEQVSLEEAQLFTNYDQATFIQKDDFDHTDGGSPEYSHRLSGSAGEVIGLSKSLKVKRGDIVRMEVWASHGDPTTSNGAAIASIGAAIANALIQTPGGIDAPGTVDAISDLFASGPIFDDDDGVSNSVPRAYLNFFFVDDNFVVQDQGFQQVTEAGRFNETGGIVTVNHERLFEEYTATRSGYLYIYLSNESTQATPVNFDDFKNAHEHAP